MSLPLTLILLTVTVAVTGPITRVMGRATGWPLAALYLAATAVFWPAATSVMRGEDPTWSVRWVPELGVDFALRADGIGVVFTFIALVIGAVVFAYSTHYLPPGRQLSFYLVMAVFTLSMVGLVLADDLVLLFLCWELTSIASFLLIARSGYSGELASMRTMLITFIGGLTLLAAVTAIAARTGTTSLHDALQHEVWSTDPGFTAGVAVLVLTSAFTKSAQFPFHVWLPDAMAAATPVSAYLHAAAVVKAGIFLLMRFSPAFHATPVWNWTLIGVGLFTSALAGWFAWQKTDLKKLMAYSTVSQLGLIVATIGVGTEAALTAAVLHTIAHALFKSGLFMMVGVIDHATGTRDIRRLPVLYREMPWSFWVTVLGCASMAGLPPMLGFVSKESILAAMLEGTPGPHWAGWAVMLGAVFASMFTFAYCAKVVFGGFIDGKQEPSRPLHPTAPGLGIPAALPIVVGLPLALVVGVLDTPVGRAVEAALPVVEEPTHLAFWHGLNIELAMTGLILAVGVVLIAQRRTLRPLIEHHLLLPVDGPWVIKRMIRWATTLGRILAQLVRADNPTRHVAVQFVALSAVLLGGTLAVHLTSGLTPAPDLDLSRPIDVVILVIVAGATLAVCRSQSRLAATVSLSAVGIAVTVQIFALGAPDVGLTQLLVEALTVLMIMLVLQKLPVRFGRGPRLGHRSALLLALTGGLAAAVGTWALTGRRERSQVAQYYLNDGPVETGGDNIVNTILVEFRALDTLGELTVLGMAGVAIVALISTVRDRHLDPDPEHDRNFVPPPDVPLDVSGSTADTAIHQAWGNAVPLQLLVRTTAPLLAAISLILFLRGHHAPGGGFIAALVGSAIVALVYLSAAQDHRVGPRRLPLALIATGIALALGTGLWGLLAKGSFLEPLHGEAFGQDLSSAIVFDLGVYAAVLGLVMVAFNLLGAATETDEGTRARADEAVEGELGAPMDTARGERPTRVTPTSSFLTSGTPPPRHRGGRR